MDLEDLETQRQQHFLIEILHHIHHGDILLHIQIIHAPVKHITFFFFPQHKLLLNLFKCLILILIQLP